MLETGPGTPGRRALGVPVCAVCGEPILGPALRMTDGRTWCISHRLLPACAWCRLPIQSPIPGAAPRACRICERSAVRSGGAVVTVKDELKQHMASLGVVVTLPTRIKLVAADGFGSGAAATQSHHLGTTSWREGVTPTLTDPITIRVLRGLPLPWFRHVVAHEFGHAALAGSPGFARIGPQLQEGFSEALGVLHLRSQGSAAESHVVEALLANPDPVYGAGLRLCLPVVERRGLRTTMQALRAGRPESVGLPAH